jgi:hypothetical protein
VDDGRIALAQQAEALAGVPVLAMVPAGQGANSHIVRLETQTGPLALKVYPRRPGDQRDRLEVEWQALRFLGESGLTQAPRAIARDDANRLMLMEWIDGDIITRHQPGDLDDALRFVEGIFRASQDAGASSFPLASEACLSATEICRQIDQRFNSFVDYAPLDRALGDIVKPAYAAARTTIASELVTPSDLAPSERRLIPADFGFHNAIRQHDGTVRYIDFDYFGWDDPVKCIADFVVHPAMSLDADERAKVVARLTNALPDSVGASARLRRHLPLYAIRWALILLNAFRKDRAAALPADEDARSTVFVRQWQKARDMIERYR